jgi:hypothetical protein
MNGQPDGSTSTFVDRVVGALRLDVDVYRAVGGDTGATGQAVRVVLLAGLCNGIALSARLGVAGVVAGVLVGLLGWVLWAMCVALVGALARRRAPTAVLMRVLGFANAPGLLLAGGVVPQMATSVRVLVALWLVAATVPAAQAAFDVSRGRAIVLALVAFAVYLALGVLSAQFAQ